MAPFEHAERHTPQDAQSDASISTWRPASTSAGQPCVSMQARQLPHKPHIRQRRASARASLSDAQA
jgi:hypothetical protein